MVIIFYESQLKMSPVWRRNPMSTLQIYKKFLVINSFTHHSYFILPPQLPSSIHSLILSPPLHSFITSFLQPFTHKFLQPDRRDSIITTARLHPLPFSALLQTPLVCTEHSTAHQADNRRSKDEWPLDHENEVLEKSVSR